MAKLTTGLDRDVQAKIASSHDSAQEREIRGWIEELIGEHLPSPNLEASLKNGVYLCKLINVILPGSVPKINSGSMPFVQMENINNFLAAARLTGIATVDLFMTVDLYEGKNMGLVIRCLENLRRIAAKRGIGSDVGTSTKPSGGVFDYVSQRETEANIDPICSACRADLPKGARFCTKCGARV